MARLYINSSESRCGVCDTGANPREIGHFTRLGYSSNGRGCGELWDSVSSDYFGSHLTLLNTDQFPNLIGLPVYEVFRGKVGMYGSIFTSTSYNKYDADGMEVGNTVVWN